MSQIPEPFGYFKPEPFGWTDCAETDEGAIPLYDKAALILIQKEYSALLESLAGLIERCDQACQLYRRIAALDAIDTAILCAESDKS